MKDETMQRLNAINQDFYQTDACEFNQTRSFFWLGWNQILNLLKKNKKLNVFDVGCGNGRFALFLKKNNFKFTYFGCDQSSNLLNFARDKLIENKINFNLKIIDLINQTNKLNLYKNQFDLISLFGVWHHIPSNKKRVELLKNLVNNLKQDGILIISFWQFVKNKKLVQRNQPNFQHLKIDENDLEKNDYLLTWEKGAKKYRYCHFSDLKEIKNIIKNIDLKIINHYYADGKNNEMNLYVIFQKT